VTDFTMRDAYVAARGGGPGIRVKGREEVWHNRGVVMNYKTNEITGLLLAVSGTWTHYNVWKIEEVESING
jgi:hypothetical protein